MKNLFSTLSSSRMAKIIGTAESFVCYAGPGIQLEPANAIVKVANRLGPEAVAVCLDFSERVARMGYGDIEAVRSLREAKIVVCHANGLRTAMLIVDDGGYIFTPTALYLEAEPEGAGIHNAMRLSSEQLTEALARLSPVAKAIAIAKAPTEEERVRLQGLPVEISAKKIENDQFKKVEKSLNGVPPVEFDLARQVRVYSAYLQYVEMNLTGAAIQRHRVAIPQSLQDLGGSDELKGRLRTTFELIEKDGKLSSKKLEEELTNIRKNFTRSLGKGHGRVVLKSAKPCLEEKLKVFRTNLEAHQKTVAIELQNQLNQSCSEIIDYYVPRVVANRPDSFIGQYVDHTEDGARAWLKNELSKVFPEADSLIKKMKLDVRYKDMTFATLNDSEFLDSVKSAFPGVNWIKAHKEFLAAGEAETKG